MTQAGTRQLVGASNATGACPWNGLNSMLLLLQVLCSHQFALVRPLLIQVPWIGNRLNSTTAFMKPCCGFSLHEDLELCYAGFCSRNGISMARDPAPATVEALVNQHRALFSPRKGTDRL